MTLTDPNTSRLEPARDDLGNQLINPSLVKYIKLGAGGDREDECIDNNLIFIGFGTHDDSYFNLAIRKEWHEFDMLRNV